MNKVKKRNRCLVADPSLTTCNTSRGHRQAAIAAGSLPWRSFRKAIIVADSSPSHHLRLYNWSLTV